MPLEFYFSTQSMFSPLTFAKDQLSPLLANRHLDLIGKLANRNSIVDNTSSLVAKGLITEKKFQILNFQVFFPQMICNKAILSIQNYDSKVRFFIYWNTLRNVKKITAK